MNDQEMPAVSSTELSPALPATALADSPASQLRSPSVLVEVKGLKKYFPIKEGFVKKIVGYVKAVDDVSFFINEGETLGLVGESGCGKTTTSRCILRAHDPTAGQILFRRKSGEVVDVARHDGRIHEHAVAQPNRDLRKSIAKRLAPFHVALARLQAPTLAVLAGRCVFFAQHRESVAGTSHLVDPLRVVSHHHPKRQDALQQRMFDAWMHRATARAGMHA